MTPLALAALMLVMSIQSSLDIQFIDQPVVRVLSESAGSRTVETRRGWTVCTTTRYPDGRIVGHVDSVTAIPYGDTFEHELLHAVSCLATGETQGRLLPHACMVRDCEHEWVHWALEHPEQAVEIMKNVQGGR